MDQMFAELSTGYRRRPRCCRLCALARELGAPVQERQLQNREIIRLCLPCARLGVMLPGTTTIIDQIMVTRVEYEAALREGDKAAEQNNGRNLKPMKDYLNRLLEIQMNGIQP